MEPFLADTDAIRTRALSELKAVSTSDQLDAWRIAYLGRQGAVTMLLRGLGELPPEKRREAGVAANALRAELEAALEVRRVDVERNALEALESGSIDVSLPGRHGLVGRLHPDYPDDS